MRERKDKHIGLAVETAIYNRLKELAIEDNRTVANLVRYIIKLYIKNIDDGTIKLSIYTMFKH